MLIVVREKNRKKKRKKSRGEEEEKYCNVAYYNVKVLRKHTSVRFRRIRVYMTSSNGNTYDEREE